MSSDPKADAKKVYLSYAWPDRRDAENLRARLASHDIASVVNDMNLQAGSNWQQELDRNLESAEAVVVLVGETTHQSDLIEREANLARKLGKPVVAVKLAPGFILPSPLYDVAATWTDVSRCEDAVSAILSKPKER
jgi:hypothetical protein